jgi:hypothetical protein
LLLVGLGHWLGHVQDCFGGQAGAFELNGGVSNLKVAGQHISNPCEDSFTLFHVHIRDANVAGERVQIGSQRPYMNVVHLAHAFDAQYGVRYVLEVQIPRHSLKQNVTALAQDGCPRPKHRRADADSDERIDPMNIEKANEQRRPENRDVLERVP